MNRSLKVLLRNSAVVISVPGNKQAVDVSPLVLKFIFNKRVLSIMIYVLRVDRLVHLGGREGSQMVVRWPFRVEEPVFVDVFMRALRCQFIRPFVVSVLESSIL